MSGCYSVVSCCDMSIGVRNSSHLAQRGERRPVLCILFNINHFLAAHIRMFVVNHALFYLSPSCPLSYSYHPLSLLQALSSLVVLGVIHVSTLTQGAKADPV